MTTKVRRSTRNGKVSHTCRIFKEETNAHIKKVSAILKKSEFARTEDECQLLEQSGDIVDVITKRTQLKEQTKQRHLEIEDGPDLLFEKCQRLALAIQQAKSLVIYTGAGISTAASIPDYRGPNGVWTLLKQGKQCRTPDLSTAEPTFTHMAVVELFHRGFIKHVVSQNCDGLHMRSGLPRSSLSELHGNMYIEMCSTCRPHREFVRLFDVTERTAIRRHKTGRLCHFCGGQLQDTIVHFGEKGGLHTPYNWQQAADAADRADVILCLGSSLKVLKRYPCLWGMHKPASKRPKLFIINLQWTPKDYKATLKINGKCDETMLMVMNCLNLQVLPYNRNLDPIFFLAVPLKSSESKSTLKKMIYLPPSISMDCLLRRHAVSNQKIQKRRRNTKDVLLRLQPSRLVKRSSVAAKVQKKKTTKQKEQHPNSNLMTTLETENAEQKIESLADKEKNKMDGDSRVEICNNLGTLEIPACSNDSICIDRTSATADGPSYDSLKPASSNSTANVQLSDSDQQISDLQADRRSSNLEKKTDESQGRKFDGSARHVPGEHLSTEISNSHHGISPPFGFIPELAGSYSRMIDNSWWNYVDSRTWLLALQNYLAMFGSMPDWSDTSRNSLYNVPNSSFLNPFANTSSTRSEQLYRFIGNSAVAIPELHWADQLNRIPANSSTAATVSSSSGLTGTSSAEVAVDVGLVGFMHSYCMTAKVQKRKSNELECQSPSSADLKPSVNANASSSSTNIPKFSAESNSQGMGLQAKFKQFHDWESSSRDESTTSVGSKINWLDGKPSDGLGRAGLSAESSGSMQGKSDIFNGNKCDLNLLNCIESGAEKKMDNAEDSSLTVPGWFGKGLCVKRFKRKRSK